MNENLPGALFSDILSEYIRDWGAGIMSPIVNSTTNRYYVTYEEGTCTRVLDGDTVEMTLAWTAPNNKFSPLKVGTVRNYRWVGIDAPETGKSSFGKQRSTSMPVADAAAAMATLLCAGKPISVLNFGLDIFGKRHLGLVFVEHEGAIICANLRLLELGMAAVLDFSGTGPETLSNTVKLRFTTAQQIARDEAAPGTIWHPTNMQSTGLKTFFASKGISV